MSAVNVRAPPGRRTSATGAAANPFAEWTDSDVGATPGEACADGSDALSSSFMAPSAVSSSTTATAAAAAAAATTDGFESLVWWQRILVDPVYRAAVSELVGVCYRQELHVLENHPDLIAAPPSSSPAEDSLAQFIRIPAAYATVARHHPLPVQARSAVSSARWVPPEAAFVARDVDPMPGTRLARETLPPRRTQPTNLVGVQQLAARLSSGRYSAYPSACRSDDGEPDSPPPPPRGSAVICATATAHAPAAAAAVPNPMRADCDAVLGLSYYWPSALPPSGFIRLAPDARRAMWPPELEASAARARSDVDRSCRVAPLPDLRGRQAAGALLVSPSPAPAGAASASAERAWALTADVDAHYRSPLCLHLFGSASAPGSQSRRGARGGRGKATHAPPTYLGTYRQSSLLVRYKLFCRALHEEQRLRTQGPTAHVGGSSGGGALPPPPAAASVLLQGVPVIPFPVLRVASAAEFCEGAPSANPAAAHDPVPSTSALMVDRFRLPHRGDVRRVDGSAPCATQRRRELSYAELSRGRWIGLMVPPTSLADPAACDAATRLWRQLHRHSQRARDALRDIYRALPHDAEGCIGKAAYCSFVHRLLQLFFPAHLPPSENAAVAEEEWVYRGTTENVCFSGFFEKFFAFPFMFLRNLATATERDYVDFWLLVRLCLFKPTDALEEAIAAATAAAAAVAAVATTATENADEQAEYCDEEGKSTEGQGVGKAEDGRGTARGRAPAAADGTSAGTQASGRAPRAQRRSEMDRNLKAAMREDKRSSVLYVQRLSRDATAGPPPLPRTGARRQSAVPPLTPVTEKGAEVDDESTHSDADACSATPRPPPSPVVFAGLTLRQVRTALATDYSAPARSMGGSPPRSLPVVCAEHREPALGSPRDLPAATVAPAQASSSSSSSSLPSTSPPAAAKDCPAVAEAAAAEGAAPPVSLVSTAVLQESLLYRRRHDQQHAAYLSAVAAHAAVSSAWELYRAEVFSDDRLDSVGSAAAAAAANGVAGRGDGCRRSPRVASLQGNGLVLRDGDVRCSVAEHPAAMLSTLSPIPPEALPSSPPVGPLPLPSEPSSCFVERLRQLQRRSVIDVVSDDFAVARPADTRVTPAHAWGEAASPPSDEADDEADDEVDRLIRYAATVPDEVFSNGHVSVRSCFHTHEDLQHFAKELTRERQAAPLAQGNRVQWGQP